MSKIPVTASALIQRAKRGYLSDGHMLKTAREGSKAHSLGPFYSVGLESNAIECSRLTITDLATEYLKPHEMLAE